VGYAGFIDRNAEIVSKAAQDLDALVVSIDQATLSRIGNCLRMRIAPQSNAILIGNSASEMATAWPDQVSTQYLPVTVIQDSRDRSARKLFVPPRAVQGNVLLVDDVAVSGTTLRAAREALSGYDEAVALVGMAFDSRKLRQQVALPLYEVLRYRQEGGGKLPINSFSTLARNRSLREAYAGRKFGDVNALEPIVRIYNQGENQ